ncbi:dienelactone hydrolase family protein [Rhizorhapis suberifaciens]|uniref:Carboxymethylenebutenolidase n=1 Tax=Rhizorhapis suberifaciens TaxID=13656 RepID=A0A840HW19_9SPHN|nr:dienelactone hydrolase family protein [Rhizorhapis suberifaciens]MBB4642492.1 carboxymethylenebutenolidase [Rhizorhapis suberifaciens]
MCDERTEAENERWLAGLPLGRREFNVLSAGAAISVLLPGGTATAASPSKAKVTSNMVSVTTPDGTADAFFVHPSSGRHPAVIMWPDIAGLRDAYKSMATRLAQAGYAVLAVNQYYRSSPAPIMNSLTEWRTDAGQARLKPMVAAITPGGTISDAKAFVDWLDRQAAVDTRHKIGTCGYCMGGPFSFRTAAARPARVGALASFHGGNLVTDAADSPHLLIPRMRAAMLVAIARNDDEREPDTKKKLLAAAKAAKRPAEIEVYPAQHGWCTIDAPVYDEAQAEKAWDRMLATFTRHL